MEFVKAGASEMAGWLCATHECYEPVYILIITAALFVVGFVGTVAMAGFIFVVDPPLSAVERFLGLLTPDDPQLGPGETTPMFPYAMACLAFCGLGAVHVYAKGGYNAAPFICMNLPLALAPLASRRIGFALRIASVCALGCILIAWGDRVDWMGVFVYMILYPAVEIMGGLVRRKHKQP